MSEEWTTVLEGQEAPTPEPQAEAPVTEEQSLETQSEEVVAEKENVEEVSQSADAEREAHLKALAERERLLNEREAESQSQAEKIKAYQELQEQIKENPTKALEHFGIDMDELLAYQLGIEAEKPEPKSELEQLRDEIREMKEAKIKEAQDKEAASIEAAVNEYKEDLNDLLETEKDAYELINLQGEQDLVWEVVEQHYNDSGEILDPKDAADLVENYLYDNYKKLYDAASKFKKQETPQEVQPEAQKEEQPIERDSMNLSFTDETINPNKPKTLSRGGRGSSISSKKRLSDEESKKRAADLLKWT